MRTNQITEAKVNGQWRKVVGNYSFEGIGRNESGLKVEGLGNVDFMFIQDTR